MGGGGFCLVGGLVLGLPVVAEVGAEVVGGYGGGWCRAVRVVSWYWAAVRLSWDSWAGVGLGGVLGDGGGHWCFCRRRISLVQLVGQNGLAAWVWALLLMIAGRWWAWSWLRQVA